MAITPIDTAIGPLALTAGPAGLVRIGFGPVAGGPDPGDDSASTGIAEAAASELEEYFAGCRRLFRWPLTDPAAGGSGAR
jgi:hypothetical protein